MICPDDHSHSNYCYTHHKCRCDRCRQMRADFARERYNAMSPEERHQYNSRRRVTKKDLAYKFEPWQIAVAERVFGK